MPTTKRGNGLHLVWGGGYIFVWGCLSPPQADAWLRPCIQYRQSPNLPINTALNVGFYVEYGKKHTYRSRKIKYILKTLRKIKYRKLTPLHICIKTNK